MSITRGKRPILFTMMRIPFLIDVKIQMDVVKFSYVTEI
jgi:hypothetical protein